MLFLYQTQVLVVESCEKETPDAHRYVLFEDITKAREWIEKEIDHKTEKAVKTGNQYKVINEEDDWDFCEYIDANDEPETTNICIVPVMKYFEGK